MYLHSGNGNDCFKMQKKLCGCLKSKDSMGMRRNNLNVSEVPKIEARALGFFSNYENKKKNICACSVLPVLVYPY